MEIVASIQARMGSSRLPGKVLENICGKPLLLWQVERIKRSKFISNVIVATSNSPVDDEIEEFCKTNKINCFRGPEDDVLQRITDLLVKYDILIHAEFYGDSPLVDPLIIDQKIEIFKKNQHKADYFSSAIETTYPPGLEVTLYPSEVLKKVNDMVQPEDPLREHVGFNITRFKEQFRVFSIKAPVKYYKPNIYLEVDTKEDLIFIRKIISHFVSINKYNFGIDEIINYLNKNPDLSKINNTVKRKWKELRENEI